MGLAIYAWDPKSRVGILRNHCRYLWAISGFLSCDIQQLGIWAGVVMLGHQKIFC